MINLLKEYHAYHEAKGLYGVSYNLSGETDLYKNIEIYEHPSPKNI